MLHNIKTRASLRGGREDGCYARRDVRKPSWPKLCVLKKTWPEFAQLRRQFTAERQPVCWPTDNSVLISS